MERGTAVREVVRRVQAFDRIIPIGLVDQVIPFWNEIAQRASVMTERYAAVHATSGLDFQLRIREWLVHLLPVPQPDRDRPTRRPNPPVPHEATKLTHEELPCY